MVEPVAVGPWGWLLAFLPTSWRKLPQRCAGCDKKGGPTVDLFPFDGIRWYCSPCYLDKKAAWERKRYGATIEEMLRLWRGG